MSATRPAVTPDDVRCAKLASDSLGIPAHVIVTDLSQNIVHVNSSFENFTGFSKQEVLGKRSNFLQGELTDPRDVQDLKLAVQSKRETNVVILNYTKKHDAFWNTLRLRPLYQSRSGELMGYVGEIFSFPVSNVWLNDRPMLCLDDALVLMRVASSVPRSVLPPGALGDGEEEEEVVEEEIVSITSNMKQQCDGATPCKLQCKVCIFAFPSSFP
ncbi:hypothetical protein BASA82_000449 [Batrachochytrium salamandrivorans]|nr:hypothetical protein BASA82_000449 [Batrachochytrium salamandrivorans]